MNRLKARFWFQVAVMYRFIGLRSGHNPHFQSAERAFNQAIALNPGFHRALYNRGLLYWRELNAPTRAIADFTTALEQAPESVEILFMRGMAYQAVGDYRAAVADLESFLAQQSNSRWAGSAHSQLYALYAILEDLPPALPASGSGSFNRNS